MILRRIIAHFRKQEWTAIFLDFVIVVVGVFVGLQVNNWNAARADRAVADAYLERIVADLSADLDDYDDRMKFWSAVSDFSRAGLAYAERGDAGGRSNWELLLAFFQASQVAEFFTTSATWDEMRSAGDLRLIRNLDLRRQLARYYTYAGNPALSERPAYRENVRGRIPDRIQAYIWERCYASDSSGRQRIIDCAAPIDDAVAKAVVDAIADDEALMRELRYWLSTMIVAGRIGNDRVSAATEVKAAVEAELGRVR